MYACRRLFTGKTEWIRQEDLPFDFAQRLPTPLSKLADHDEQLRELFTPVFCCRPKTMPRQSEQGGSPSWADAK